VDLRADAIPEHLSEFLMILPVWARWYVGIPYLDYGRDARGCDCWGLARMIWSDRAGIELPEHAVDPHDGEACQGEMRSHLGPWRMIDPGHERELDGVLMTGCFGEGRATRRANMHVGVVVAPGWLIHTSSAIGAAALARYNERLLGHEVKGFWRHRELDA
jgi:probable lipoprotein NlpC